jgi:transposase
MTRPYSEDLRDRALLLAEQGATIRAIGDALQISPSCVSKWRKLQRETGSLKHGKIGGHKRPVLSGATASWLRERLRSGPFTMRKLKAELTVRGVKTHASVVWLFVRAAGLSFKKKRSCQWSRIGRTSPASASAGCAHQGRIDPKWLVFLDETWVKTNMAPLRGW